MGLNIKFWVSLIITSLLCYISVSIIKNNIFIYTLVSISLIITMYYFVRTELIKIKNYFIR